MESAPLSAAARAKRPRALAVVWPNGSANPRATLPLMSRCTPTVSAQDLDFGAGPPIRPLPSLLRSFAIS
jgi:hypothetical protein